VADEPVREAAGSLVTMSSSPPIEHTASDVAGCAPVLPVDAVAAPDDATLAQLAKALGHPARIRILRLLATRETCITGDVVAELPLAQSTVSEHLRILREAGLVQSTPDGTRTTYCLSPAGLATLKRGIAAL
jgi:ArsR family transcriptional regulator, arsenate/arsenite/antimonite-responsive transcriptional repressor